MRPFIFALLLLPTTVVAQSANQVTLKYDDGSGVSGELIEFKDDKFRIQASVGMIVIPAQDVSCIGTACPDGTAFEVPAAPVTLTGKDGTFTLSGNVIEFVDDEYVLATDIGEIRIAASLATCEGAGCVAPQEPINRNVTLVNGATTIEGELIRIEDGYYIVEVDQLGEMRVDANTFECRGEACS